MTDMWGGEKYRPSDVEPLVGDTMRLDGCRRTESGDSPGGPDMKVGPVLSSPFLHPDPRLSSSFASPV